MEWDTLFNDLAAFMLNISARERSSDSNVAESVLVTIQCYSRVMYAIKETLHEANGGDRELLETLSIVTDLLSDLEEIRGRWVLLEAGVDNPVNQYQAVRVQLGRGRPRVVIEQEKIEFLRELKFSWTEIASIFGVCRRTLYSVRL